mmetsp:Transcript_11821/g.18148  ORF Transcript_11821/g.18148 Transcript_11821/m.18148 type:complete len:249 (-) Transcript_11821:153-899(-)|eukprot:CAMPEP_0178910112 /NCGR_PEP_ID=MMETSP0786-20121207/8914_1 /TAXON_ID=186022 /ORGANISM="Thalassionema frauenfeldii, Strain CCMP 1798" /LENGTH=248 /DNA_ID=CAMNT_0020582323 /DNA_START=54 /DNA_END=800 /DNA_ORIENTATION=-
MFLTKTIISVLILTAQLSYSCAFITTKIGVTFATNPYTRSISSDKTQLQGRDQSLQAKAKTTLSDETTWTLRFLLKGIPTEKGRKVDEIFVVNVQFLEEEGYEPPQGEMRQVLTTEQNESGSALKISNAVWKLSEDPNERKDGLWVWGLFEEPLYPFMLLQMDTEAVPLPGEEGDVVKPLKLYAQLSHSRDKEEGVILKGGNLNIREKETYKLDPFGASSVDLFEDVTVGQVNIQPLLSKGSITGEKR